MGTQGPKKPNWLVQGAFGGSGEALSWGKKAKLPLGQLKRLSYPTQGQLGAHTQEGCFAQGS